MRVARWITALAGLLGAVVLANCLTVRGGVDPDAMRARLPGAMPVIEASQYPSIQAALDALPAAGGAVRLPPGTFEIREPLRISGSDVLLEGAGTATHIRNLNVEGKSAILLQHPSGQDNRKAELWRIRLANFRLTGNERSGHGIEAKRVNEIFIEGVTVSSHGGDGIHLHFCYEDPRICDSLITYNKKTGLNLVGCHDIVVAANQFEENQDAVRCADGFNLCMTGNNLDDHLGNGIIIENTYGSVVSGNMIEECKGTAIILDRDCYGIALSANVIAHNGGGIDLRDAHGCTLSATTFTIVQKDAVRIGPASGRITVTGNNFSDSYVGEGTVIRPSEDRTAAGLTLDGATHVAVVGNLFSSLRPKAVIVDGTPASRILFADNVLVDTGADSEKADRSIVEGNMVD